MHCISLILFFLHRIVIGYLGSVPSHACSWPSRQARGLNDRHTSPTTPQPPTHTLSYRQDHTTTTVRRAAAAAALASVTYMRCCAGAHHAGGTAAVGARAPFGGGDAGAGRRPPAARPRLRFCRREGAGRWRGPCGACPRLPFLAVRPPRSCNAAQYAIEPAGAWVRATVHHSIPGKRSWLRDLQLPMPWASLPASLPLLGRRKIHAEGISVRKCRPKLHAYGGSLSEPPRFELRAALFWALIPETPDLAEVSCYRILCSLVFERASQPHLPERGRRRRALGGAVSVLLSAVAECAAAPG